MYGGPFEMYELWRRMYGYGDLPITPSAPYYPYSGTYDEMSSPLPQGFKVVFENARYYPLFDGASYRVTLDFGNGTFVFYPSGFIEVGDNLEFLKIEIYYKDEKLFSYGFKK